MFEATPQGDTLVGALLWNTLAENCCGTLLWDTLILLWDTLVGKALGGQLLWDTLERHSCGARALGGHLSEKFVGHSCRTLLFNTLVGHSCGTLLRRGRTLLRDTRAGDSCMTLLWDTLAFSKTHVSSLQNERFRTRLPPKVRRQVSKRSALCVCRNAFAVCCHLALLCCSHCSTLTGVVQVFLYLQFSRHAACRNN